MEIIVAKLYVEDVMNPSNQEAVDYVTELISEAFGREERKEYPRIKLILLEVTRK